MIVHAAVLQDDGTVWHDSCQCPSTFADWTLIAYGLAYQSAWSMDYAITGEPPACNEVGEPQMEANTLYIWTTPE